MWLKIHINSLFTYVKKNYFLLKIITASWIVKRKKINLEMIRTWSHCCRSPRHASHYKFEGDFRRGIIWWQYIHENSDVPSNQDSPGFSHQKIVLGHLSKIKNKKIVLGQLSRQMDFWLYDNCIHIWKKID